MNFTHSQITEILLELASVVLICVVTEFFIES
jgi:hypothetical protein